MRKLTAVAIAASIAALTPANAHDPDGKFAQQNPALHQWFDQLASKKGLCCSFADGLTLQDVDWRSRDGHYEVRIPAGVVNGYGDKKAPAQDVWKVVPESALITEPNKFGPAVVWPTWDPGEPDEVNIRCFIPGAGA